MCLSPTESSPTRGGETESPPPRGSRRLRDRARQLSAQGAQTVLGARTGAEPCARSRYRVRPAAARGEYLGPAFPGGENRHRHASPARARAEACAHRYPRGCALNAATQGLVRLPVWRARFVLAALLAAFAVLGARSLYLQALQTDFLQEKGDARYSRLIEVPATRGRILDRNGEALAVSTPVKSIWAISSDVDLKPADKRKLLGLLGMTSAEFDRKLAEAARDFVYLKRQLPPDTADAIAQLGLRGIYEQREYRRYYPAGEVTAHLIGFTGIDDAGQEALELAYEESLGGRRGSRRVIKDRLGHVVEDVQSIRAAQDGADLTLSIDGKIQSLAFSALKAAVERHHAKAGALLALDVHTGEVLALANVPSFNPNNRARLTGAELRNRVITDLFEPGSTLKPFTVALALESGKVTPQTTIATAPGRLTLAKYTIRDVHPAAALTVAQILQKSSNVGAAKLALALPREAMYGLFQRVG